MAAAMSAARGLIAIDVENPDAAEKKRAARYDALHRSPVKKEQREPPDPPESLSA